MSSPLSRASSRWLIILLCRKSSTGIVVLLPVSIVSGLYGSPDAFQGDFVSAIEQTTSFIGSLHLRRRGYAPHGGGSEPSLDQAHERRSPREIGGGTSIRLLLLTSG